MPLITKGAFTDLLDEWRGWRARHIKDGSDNSLLAASIYEACISDLEAVLALFRAPSRAKPIPRADLLQIAEDVVQQDRDLLDALGNE